MSIQNAFKMFVGFFAQDATGAAYAPLDDPAYSALKFGKKNLIPLELELTNVARGETTTETREKKAITDLDRWTRFSVGKKKQGEISFNAERPLDMSPLDAELEKLAVDEPELGLLVVGEYKETTTDGKRVFDVVFATAAFYVAGGGLNGEAAGALTSAIKFQPTGKPLDGTAANQTTATVDLSTNEVVLETTQKQQS